jgi:hypothetical protein
VSVAAAGAGLAPPAGAAALACWTSPAAHRAGWRQCAQLVAQGPSSSRPVPWRHTSYLLPPAWLPRALSPPPPHPPPPPPVWATATARPGCTSRTPCTTASWRRASGARRRRGSGAPSVARAG